MFDDESDQWLITIGFSRPWDRPKVLSAALREDPLKRSYKVVRINDADGRVIVTQGSRTDRCGVTQALQVVRKYCESCLE